jgi:hypothetical protein
MACLLCDWMKFQNSLAGFNRGRRTGASMSKADEADRDERLKKIDIDNALFLKRLEFYNGQQKDALAFTKEYGLFTLRELLILDGGAILAILTFIGNLYGRGILAQTLKIHDFAYPLMLFTLGLVLTIIASILCDCVIDLLCVWRG